MVNRQSVPHKQSNREGDGKRPAPPRNPALFDADEGAAARSQPPSDTDTAVCPAPDFSSTSLPPATNEINE